MRTIATFALALACCCSHPTETASTRRFEARTSFDPTALDPIAWPDEIGSASRRLAIELADRVARTPNDNVSGAATKLAGLGRAGFIAIVNRLRTVDYLDEEGSDGGRALNEILTKHIIHRELGYVSRGQAKVRPVDAEWNAGIVQAWMDFYARRATQEAWDQWQKYVRLVPK